MFFKSMLILYCNKVNEQCMNILITSSGGAAEKQSIKLGFFTKSSLVHNDRPTYTNANGITRLFYAKGTSLIHGWRVSHATE